MELKKGPFLVQQDLENVCLDLTSGGSAQDATALAVTSPLFPFQEELASSTSKRD